MATLASIAIDWAEAEVSKYLSARYDLSASPFGITTAGTSTPPLVRSITEQLALAYTYRLGMRGNLSSEMAKELKVEAIENLELVKDYKIDILNTAGSKITEAGKPRKRVQSSTSTYEDTFGEDTSTAWAIDSDKLTDIADTRS